MTELESHDEVFADTCVLLNFVQQEWGRDHCTRLVESQTVELIVSPNVIEELESVTERRRDVYEDLLDFLLAEEGTIEEYDPDDRRVYISENDAGHVRDLQMTLAQLDDRREILRRLRRFVRAADSRVDHLQASLEGNTVDPMAPFELELALGRLLDHGADARIVTDAAGWTADGGSGTVVTLDSEDLLDREEAIADLLLSEQGPDWVVNLVAPEAVLESDASPRASD